MTDERPAIGGPRKTLARNLLAFGCVWGIVSVVAGVAACWIPWGRPGRLHGKGFPIPVVIWDKPPGSDDFIDYVGMAGFLLNPLCFMLAGWALAGVFLGLRWAGRKCFGKPGAGAE